MSYEHRFLLRHIQGHLSQSCLNAGAIRESLGLVDVYHHLTDADSPLNFVTPRRNTAWVSNVHMQAGVEWLRALRRKPRIQYIQQLLMPAFTDMVKQMGFCVAQEESIWFTTESLPEVQNLAMPHQKIVTPFNERLHTFYIGKNLVLPHPYQFIGSVVTFAEVKPAAKVSSRRSIREKKHEQSAMEQFISA